MMSQKSSNQRLKMDILLYLSKISKLNNSKDKSTLFAKKKNLDFELDFEELEEKNENIENESADDDDDDETDFRKKNSIMQKMANSNENFGTENSEEIFSVALNVRLLVCD